MSWLNETLRTLLFLPEQASSVAGEIDALHYVVILTSLLGSAAVSAAVLYFLVRYRRSAQVAAADSDADSDADSAAQHADVRPAPSRRRGMPLALEIAVVLGLLGMFVGWWVIGFRQFVNLRTAPEDAMRVYVTGKKWMWSFAYPDGQASNAVLYVPAGQPVELLLSSRDVIHSFYVPAFRLKHDAVPGRMNSMWFEAEKPGVYPILCAEYCGDGHATMRGQVVVLAPADYQAQRGLAPGEQAGPAGALAAGDSMAAQGERLATRHGCMRCHTADGTPHIGPSFARVYERELPLVGGATVRADEAYLTESMMDPLARVRRGFQPVMPSYQGLLSAPEIAAIVEYIRSLRDVPPSPPAPPPTGPLQWPTPAQQGDADAPAVLDPLDEEGAP
ncbi:cytochrome c oxidase subunit II [Haliangium ochraceum]|uniref:cytochrome-c oxidase n=1 Tax=Haliangium ochraceum (strain DSM 14365 / JCM 11303 / SMP-2) TaxID=502025 RepID=D0LN58_HALO1|nr:cytochrome c oxidase subunit II [Haliangium ochraceum]ACY15235.1 cytochrome c oxidase, subunit II [Haliangium ochraceum DSM 14365]